MDTTFDPQTLADDLSAVSRMYTQFFASLDDTSWEKLVKGGRKEWNQHETVAHLVALNGDGLESIQYGLRGEPYTFTGLENRYQFNAWNRAGINRNLSMPREALCAKVIAILDQATQIARALRPDQAELTMRMPIYNRPVKIVEALGIINFHAGLSHTAQVTEPAGVPPLWLQLTPEIRHRVIGRVMRAFSLLYRIDLGGELRDTIVFRIDGPGGGEWFVKLSPDVPTSGEGVLQQPGLVVHLRETAVFCQMLTSRINLPIALLSGAMKLHGNLRLFWRMGDLFSVDARPSVSTKARPHLLPNN